MNKVRAAVAALLLAGVFAATAGPASADGGLGPTLSPFSWNEWVCGGLAGSKSGCHLL